MIRRYGAAFRGSTNDTFVNGVWNMIDAFNQGTAGTWSQGQTLLDVIQIHQRTVAPSWQALAFSMSADFNLNYNPPSVMYGKLGRVLCGLSTQGDATPDPNIVLGTTSGKLYPLPRDNSLITTLWDPASDPLPPINGAGPITNTQVLRVAADVTLPQPLPVPAGSNLFAGIWIMPSLISANVANGAPGQLSAQPCIFNASYVITYDDDPANP